MAKRAPARTPEGRESQIAALAYDAVEDRIRNGKATSQELVYFLKLGSSREQMEQERLRQENEMLKAKTESLKSAKRIEELYENALKAMKFYDGEEDEDDWEE